MQRSSLTVTLLFLGSGRIAAVGQAAMMFGISHPPLAIFSWSIFGGFRWMPTIARSEQWTAPHMFRQHATEMRSLPGSVMLSKYGCISSMIDFTSAEASVAALWQWIHPWVWTTLLIALPVPPTGQPFAFNS